MHRTLTAIAVTSVVTLASAHFSIPPADTPAADLPRAARPQPTRYAVIPIKGVIGDDVLPAGFREALALVVRRKVGHVVFEIDSDAGDPAAAHALVDALREHDERLAYHAHVVRAAGPALWLVAACDDLFVDVPGPAGAAFGALGQPEATSDLAALAQHRGHSTVIFRALADPAAEVYAWSGSGGVVTAVRERPPTANEGGASELIDGPTSTLALIPAEAVRLGLARDWALRDVLRGDAWKDAGDFAAKALAEATAKARREAAERARDMATIAEWHGLLGRHAARAEASDPAAFSDYRRDAVNRRWSDASIARWRQRTDEAIDGWTTVVKGIQQIYDKMRPYAREDFDPALVDDLRDLDVRAGLEIKRLRTNRGRDGSY